MRASIASLVVIVALAGCGKKPTGPAHGDGGSGSPDMGSASPGISDYRTIDVTPLLSPAGIWSFMDDTLVGGDPSGLVGFWGVARIGSPARDGVVLSGWVYSGPTPPAQPRNVTFGIVAQQPDGTLKLATTDYVGSNVTQGAGSVNVADFNGDGRDDIFLAAHNESPFVSEASYALLSRSDGKFDVVKVGDSVQDHDANLAIIGGKPVIVAANFDLASPSSGNPIYTYDGNGGFTIDSTVGHISAMSVAAGDFLGDGGIEIVYGQQSQGPGPNTQWDFLYHFANGAIIGDPVALPVPYYDKPQYASLQSQWDPVVKTHTPRLWVDDVNHDGKLDLVADAMVWSAAAGTQKTTLQIFVNQGGLVFTDETDALNPDWDQNGGEDHTLRMADVDGSGINTYFVAGQSFCTNPAACQPNYIAVNDGTGRLHVAMHVEFVNIGNAVNAYVNKHLPAGYLPNTGSLPIPRTIAYQTADGKIDFLALTGVYAMVNGKFNPRFVLTNVPLHIDLKTQYRENLTITDRNGSTRIRTFAGDDTIFAGGAGTSCAVDGGLGTDTIVYRGVKANYTIEKSGASTIVTDTTGKDGTDTLTNVEILKFTDGMMRL